MALPIQVKNYLAYWFQLGRGLRMPPGETLVKPNLVLAHEGYSAGFEVIWRQLLDPHVAAHSYLDGTTQTIAQLLQPDWEICDCARCGLPIPMKSRGLPEMTCPCGDLDTLPNLDELPAPRQAADNNQVLQDVCGRLNRVRIRAAG